MDVKTLCLGVLAAGPCSGYDIKKTFEERFRHFFRASYGSIYPALAGLEGEGLVVAEVVAAGRRPAKKTYAITAAGRAALETALIAEEPRHVVRSEFLVLAYFAHLLPPARLAAVLERMTAEFEAMLHADLEGWRGIEERLTPGQRFALGYGRAVLAAALDHIRAQGPALLVETAAARAAADPGGLAAAGD